MKTNYFILRLLGSLVALCLFGTVEAGKPVWSFTPLTATTLSVPSNETATVQYTVTNQSSKVHTLSMKSIPGIVQLTTGLGVCSNPFVLTGKASCTLSLQVNGSQLTAPINDGPIVCQQGSNLQCYRPALVNILHITQAAVITDATITVSGSPLTSTTNGPSSMLTINNTSLLVTATNITSDFTGTALDGNVTETGNTCASVAPQTSCTLTYTPGGSVVAQTDFTIQGSNTNALTAAIQIDAGITISTVNPSSGSASGGRGVTLIGSGFTGVTGVTFGGVAATSVNFVDSTTVTAVTPAHAAGAVDVEITTLSGSATDTNGFTYLATAVGQPAYGGKIACLNLNNNLITTNADSPVPSVWGGSGIDIPLAESTTDGQTNTTSIVAVLGVGSAFAAGYCNNYEIDSQGNSPCEIGNTCYNDWFLPAGNNTGATGQLNCLFTNRVAIGGFLNAFYWSSTEFNANEAYNQDFSSGSELDVLKFNVQEFRCVRTFTP